MIGSIFYIVASLVLKIVENQITNHQGIIIGYSVLGIASIGFYFINNFYFQSILFGLAYFGIGFVHIFSNSSIIHIYKDQAIETAFMIQTACSVIPGLIVMPFLLLVETQFFPILGIISLCLIIPGLTLVSPDSSISGSMNADKGADS